MKRELAAILLLLTLVCVSVGNLMYYDKLTDQIEAVLLLSRNAVERGDFAAARQAYRQAEERWLNAKPFTHVFIRHAEIDSTTDAFFDLKELLREENAEASEAAFDRIVYHLNSIDGMEHPSLGSVF